jgi:hypothetical protein
MEIFCVHIGNRPIRVKSRGILLFCYQTLVVSQYEWPFVVLVITYKYCASGMFVTITNGKYSAVPVSKALAEGGGECCLEGRTDVEREKRRV